MAYEPTQYYRILHGKRTPQFFSRAKHPSWASEVTAITTATSTGGMLLRMASLTLEGGNGSRLEVIDQSTHFGSGLTIVSQEEPQDFYHLEDRQLVVQAAVTKAAQEFFDAITT